ncbi:MAG: aminopeptidase [Burkholderiales bacterium]|nr:MAG: aminopeptidase [Burkholderiales bacterium]
MRERGPVAAAAAALVLIAALGGCAATTDGPGYYWQSMVGHLELINRRRPVDELLADPATEPALRVRLARALEIRAFASRELGLPANGSYTGYTDVQRPFVLWNVFATPELSLTLERWCFPVAGCVAYRGYYDRETAERFAASLRDRGLEAHVGGVPAYSTLGWFDDPLLSTFIQYPEAELARLVFHELAHQVLYVSGDTTFNESFATAVEEAGVERWLAHRADAAVERVYREHAARRLAFVALLRRYKEALNAVYAREADDDAKRLAKRSTFDALRSEYAQLKASWGGYAGYDRFFAQGPTNPQLAAVGAYNDLLPAFRALLAQGGGDLPAFYAAVRDLAALPKAARDARLRALGGRPASDDATTAPGAAPAGRAS